MKNDELIKKYELTDDDWTTGKYRMKMKAQTVIGLFIALENTLAPHVDPEKGQLIDSTRDDLLKYLDDYFINKEPDIVEQQ